MTVLTDQRVYGLTDVVRGEPRNFLRGGWNFLKSNQNPIVVNLVILSQTWFRCKSCIVTTFGYLKTLS